MIDIEYRKSCTEVIEILNHISRKDYEKIPKNIINVLETDKDNEYHFEYDMNKTLKNQNVSKQARIMIAVFFRDYWATESQKETILAIERKCRDKLEDEKREKYNPDNIFNNSHIQNKTVDSNPTNQNTQIIEYKQSIFKKIINWLKNISHKN